MDPDKLIHDAEEENRFISGKNIFIRDSAKNDKSQNTDGNNSECKVKFGALESGNNMMGLAKAGELEKARALCDSEFLPYANQIDDEVKTMGDECLDLAHEEAEIISFLTRL